MRRSVVPLLVAVAFAAAPAAASGAPFYVAPVAHGSGTCNDEANACTLGTAFANAQNAEILVRGDQGDYNLTSALSNEHSPVDVRGYKGRPHLIFSGGRLAIDGSTANNLYVETSDTQTALDLVSSTVDNVIVKTTSTGHACFVSNTTLTNSVCWAGSHGDLALETGGSNTLRNDTFFGGTEAAVKSRGHQNDCSCTASTVNLVNVIARSAAGGADLKAESDNTADITVSSRYSNYATTLKSGTTSKDHINGSATDQAPAPLFVNAGTGDFHQAPGSPTVDKGVNEAANGTADFDGDARTLNGTTDIGADECVKSCFAAAGGGGGGGGVLVNAAVNGFNASPKSFFAAGRGPSVKATRKKSKRKTGTKVSFRLNEAASVRFKVQRRQKGRRVKRKGKRVCVKPTRKNRKKRRCTRYVTLRGSFTVNGAAGANSFRFTGRVRKRKLKPGRYRLLATPTANGKRGLTVRTRFKVKRPPRK